MEEKKRIESHDNLRVYLYDEDGKLISCKRDDGYDTDVDDGYEDLKLKEDIVKINLYKCAENIILHNNKEYNVIKRVFMPCIPVCLYLYLKENKDVKLRTMNKSELGL